MYGEVIGINTAIIAGGDGIGFAIPVNIAKEIFAQLKDNGEVTRGWLGVAIQDLDKELKDYYGIEKGVLISEVFEGDPADQAGIQAKDIVFSINGNAVNSSRDLTRLIAGLGVGSESTVQVSRNGKIKIFTVKIARRDEENLLASGSGPLGRMESELGIEVSNIRPEMLTQFNLGNTDGVIVVNVQPDSKGRKSGIAKGDIIREINHQPVQNVSDYNKIVGDVKKGAAIQMHIRRLNKGFMVVKIIK
jgi:serine protease Do